MTDLTKAIDLIKEFEGLQLKAYKCPAGVWTIGYGQTAGIKQGMVWTKEQAEADLVKTVSEFSKSVERLVRSKTLDRELCAFVSLAYNIGLGNFKTSSALRWHNTYEASKVPAGIMMWDKATVSGKRVVLKGLVRRRAAEAAIYSTGKR